MDLMQSLQQYGGPSNLGATLLAASGPATSTAGGLGRALLAARQNTLTQQHQQAATQLLEQKIRQAQLLAAYRARLAQQAGIQLPQVGGAPAASPATVAAPAASPAPTGSIPRLPPPLPSTAPNTLPPTPGFRLGGMSPQMLTLGAVLSGRSPVSAITAARTERRQIAQQRAAPTLAAYSTVVKSDQPAQLVMRSPQLKSTWQRLAPQFGMDPAAPSDADVRTVFGYARQELAGELGEPVKSVPQGSADIQAYRLAQQQGFTGTFQDYETWKAQHSGQNLMDPQDEQALAEQIAHYQLPAPSSYALRYPSMQRVMALVSQINPDYHAAEYYAHESTQRSMAGGKLGQSTRFINNAIGHLNLLGQIAQDLDNGDVRGVNALKNITEREFGVTAPTSFNAVRDLVGNELIKAVTNSGGGEGERDEARKTLSQAHSYAQLVGVIDQYRHILGRQLADIGHQYQANTGLHDFEQRFVQPDVRPFYDAARTAANQTRPAAHTAAGMPSFATEAQAQAAANAGKIKSGQRITVGGVAGTWQ